jgi:glutamate formiminotransferase/formiminotetrahydrofolate cyclodeaminase
MPALVECVPNFSEGRDQSVIGAIRAAITGVAGARLLDVQSDTDHNRTVVTFVAAPDAAVEAAFAAVKVAHEKIDMRAHKGEHPRMGATDVVPFIPVEGITMAECVELAKRLGKRIGEELQIPVFLYAQAATRPSRVRLPDVRKGEFEGLRDLIGSDAERDPDFGPRRIHESAGATAVGARPFLVAYNVYLKGGDEALAKAIAKKLRTSSGGLPALQAMGITVAGQAQVSMNLLDIDETGMHAAFDAVASAAREAGADADWSEIVGLVPERALLRAAEAHLKLKEPAQPHVLEATIRQAAGPSLAQFMEAVASAEPAPGGGTVAAIAAAMAAALAAMVGRLTVGRKKYADVEPEFKAMIAEAERLRARLAQLAEEDAAAYGEVMKAYAIPKDRADERKAAIQRSMMGAAEVPLRTLEAARDVAKLCARAAAAGNVNARSDGGVGGMLAGAAAKGAYYNVLINVRGLPDATAEGNALASLARGIAEEAARYAAESAATVEQALGG